MACPCSTKTLQEILPSIPPLNKWYEENDADPIIRRHAIHWLACIESYRAPKRPRLGRWSLVYDTMETCIYKQDRVNRVLVAFRGTKAPKDLYDDTQLTMGKVFPRAAEAVKLVEDLAALNPGLTIELTGHSLGGAVAREVEKLTGLVTVTFNAAAPPSFPVVSGATDYHIVFDLISAWQSPNTVRIDKGFNPRPPALWYVIPYMWMLQIFDSVLPAHELKNFSREIPGTVVTTGVESGNIQRWFLSLPIKGRAYLLTALFGIRGALASSLPELKD